MSAGPEVGKGLVPKELKEGQCSYSCKGDNSTRLD